MTNLVKINLIVGFQAASLMKLIDSNQVGKLPSSKNKRPCSKSAKSLTPVCQPLSELSVLFFPLTNQDHVSASCDT